VRNAVIPKDPAYEARVRESFSRQSHMATLGVAIAFIAPVATMLSTIIVRPREH
jgi:hypothetical protein